MSTDAQPQVVRSYLAGLEAALSDVPSEVSREIVAGITEELDGLDPATAAARIEALGDPVFIAAEARGGVAAPPPAPAPAASRPQDPRWYTVLAALMVAFGGIVIPFLGWFVGMALVWLSKSWRTWEKWVATVTLPVAIIIGALVSVLIDRAIRASEQTSGLAPGQTIVNPELPFIPSIFDTFRTDVLLGVVVNVVVGIWLLWRALRRRKPLV
ncbi:HAAS signaling domain-containing protein [Parafrigoribacterium soli]|uniref:HAAS signaling domain-containing protein n=1 Tax=Parafrigoribacterium soli TaxID=3144663 RepID=UPI0032F0629C